MSISRPTATNSLAPRHWRWCLDCEFQEDTWQCVFHFRVVQVCKKDHELKDGEFFTFVYDGSHTFQVSVFGLSTCKEIRAVAETVDLSYADSGVVEEEDSSVVSDSNEEEEEEDDDSSFNAGEDDEVSQNLYPVDSEGTVSNNEVAGFSNLEVESNQCFTTTHKKNGKYELLIPANVVKEHGLIFCERIKYIDGEGVTHWFTGRSCDRILFKGWGSVCRRNRLKENDTVHCEMLHIRKKVNSIKIRITHHPQLHSSSSPSP